MDIENDKGTEAKDSYHYESSDEGGCDEGDFCEEKGG
jgi:hypothetical protein